MKTDVLVVFPHHSSFIDQDVRILEREFNVATFEYTERTDRYRLLKELAGTNLAVAWFVLGYAYAITRFQSLHGAKSLLIPGGWDVEAMPELGYGNMRHPKAARRTSYALTQADRVLAVSEYTQANVRKWAPRAKSTVLYHGFDGDLFRPGEEQRTDIVTVCRVAPETWELKGLHVLTEVARRLPDLRFTIAGPVENVDLQTLLPVNVRTVGFLPREELLKAYQDAVVYLQLSAVESFGCALAEAMLTECVPVVTDRGAIPEVVGPVGHKVKYGDVDGTVKAIREAMVSGEGPLARRRILDTFPLDRRAKGLLAEVRVLVRGRQ